MFESRCCSTHRSPSRFVPWLVVSLLALLAPAGAARAAARTAAPVVSPAPVIRIEPTTLYFGAATAPPSAVAGGSAAATTPPARAEIPQALRDKAAGANGVRVLVQLATPFTPE